MMLSDVRLLDPKPYAFSESIPPTVFVHVLFFRLSRAEEYKLTKFSNGFDEAHPLHSFKDCVSACANNIAIDDAGGVLDHPWEGRVSKKYLASEP